MIQYRGWEPSTEGAKIFFGTTEQHLLEQEVSATDMREMRDDMEEAAMLARGFQKHDLMMNEVDQYDQLFLMGLPFVVKSVLSGSRDTTVLDLDMATFTDQPMEVTLPADQQVTVYRRIS